MIKSWKHKGLRNFYLTGSYAGINPEHSKRVQYILQALDFATSPHDMRIPGLELHKLGGDKKDCYAVTVRANWRIVFQFEDENAYLVDYIDYH